MLIKLDNLEGPEIAELLSEHLLDMHEHSPPESVHALDLESLKLPEITFWTCWDDEELAGCGALKELEPSHGEIKSMRTSQAHLRKGVAGKILEHIIKTAKSRGYKRLSLETGSMNAFKPACKLYEKYGFNYCGPFEGYVEDPNSVFLTLTL